MQITHLAAAAALALAAPLAAAEDIVTPITFTPDNGSFLAMVEVTHTSSGLFVDSFTFDLPSPGTVSAEFFSDDPDLVLTVGSLDGVGFEFAGGTGSITLAELSGAQQLDLLGSAGDPFGASGPITAGYSGSIRYTPAVAAIPEPQTYALMLAGLGLLGLVARRRGRSHRAAYSAPALRRPGLRGAAGDTVPPLAAALCRSEPMNLEDSEPTEAAPAPTRLAVLRSYAVVGSAPEASYDELAQLAARSCGTPAAFVTFVDDQRQWFKARFGAAASEAPLEAGFCPFVVAAQQPLVIEDTHADPRHAANPAAQGAQPVRFYAGTPLVAPGGQVLGTLCVVDGRPRRIEAGQLETLAVLARQVVAQLELRRSVALLSQRAEEQHEGQERLKLLSAIAAKFLLDNTPEHDLPAIATRLAQHVEAEVFIHYLLEPDGRTLRLAGHCGLSAEAASAYAQLDIEQELCARSARERRPLVIGQAQQSQEFGAELLREMGLAAYACHPLLAEGQLIGTLAFASKRRERFSAPDLGLMQTVADQLAMAIERQRAEAGLLEANRRKDEFLATLAHELRNPLAPIRNALQILQLAEHDPQARRKARNVMERQLGQLVRLIDDLLDVSRINQGKIELRCQRVELAAVLQDGIDACAPLVEAAGQSLSVELPDEPILLHADPARLAQVFANLLNNAVKYSERGGRIRISAARRHGEAWIGVRDEGIGIPREELGRVFELFAQVGRSLERSQGGLGIGLTLVKRLVELHGGTVEARSEGLGRGAEFVLRLPALPARAAGAVPAAPVPNALRGPARRILVVDDNQDAAQSLAAMLELQGHATRSAYDGAQALALAEAWRPEVVLLDLGMPRMNGFDTCRRLRERAWGRAVKVFALTGWGQDEDRRRTHEAGFDFHLVKPVDPALLGVLLADTPATLASGQAGG